MKAIVEESRVVEQFVCFPCLNGIVVSGYNDGSCRASNLLNLLLYQIVRLLAVYLIKVHVGVKVIDDCACWSVKELAPRADTVVRGTAAFAREAFRGFVGRIAQPKVTIVEEHHCLLAIEDGGILSACAAIVASYANVGIALQSVCHIVHLRLKCFLHTKQVWLLEVDEVDEISASGVPAVAGLGVTAVFVP